MNESLKLGLGTWKNTNPTECATTVAKALEMGYRHIDTARSYNNEQYVGEGISMASVDRNEVFLATKVWVDELRYDAVIENTRDSLENLGIDYIDLLYVHWPEGEYNAEETLPAFDELVDREWVEHVGVSNFTPRELDEARDVLDASIFAHQVEMHPLLQQNELLEYARDYDMELVAYCPLARGDVFDISELREIAAEYNATPAQVSLAWLLSKKNVSAIPKATGDHLRENYEARSTSLDREALARIDSIDCEKRLVEW